MASLPTAAKLARTPPGKPPFLDVWGQIDVADGIVAFMGMKTLAKVPTICRSLRDAQPVILFKAARRLKVSPDITSACLFALHAAAPRERYRFRETWADDGNWRNRAPHMDDYSVYRESGFDNPNAPKCLVLERSGGEGEKRKGGLYHALRGDGQRSDLYGPRHGGGPLTLRRFRVQICFPHGAGEESLSSGVFRMRIGLFGPGRVKDEEDGREYTYEDSPGSPGICLGGIMATGGDLIWRSDVGDHNETTRRLCQVTAGQWYDVEANFPAPRPGSANIHTTFTVRPFTVSASGDTQPPGPPLDLHPLARNYGFPGLHNRFLTEVGWGRCGLESINIFHESNGLVRIGEIEVDYIGPG